MSFGGSVLAMITTLKNNARPKQNLKDLLKENDTKNYYKNLEVHDKVISPTELSRIKKRIHDESVIEKRRNTLVFISVFFVIIFLVVLIIACNI
ncbi:MAG: hypothetical protein PHE56_10555 [Bacteroidales bacterium]|nr:hypothetical protein [Bacteroidales bacterium]